MTPMRVDFAGGWLDVPKLAMEGATVVNCAVRPGIEYPWQFGGGMGGSAAAAIARGEDVLSSELKTAGWQDPAVILETGLCVWRSGPMPVLHAKVNPDWLEGKMAVWWTGNRHSTHDLIDRPRNYERIVEAGGFATWAVLHGMSAFSVLVDAVRISYDVQIEEGMKSLPAGGIAKKYLGSGHGGYALYLFLNRDSRDLFVKENGGIAIEPFMRTAFSTCQCTKSGDKPLLA